MNRAAVYIWLLSMAMLVSETLAVESIVVGKDGQVTWTQAREVSQFVTVRQDSIWMWNITADGNLAADLAARGGGVYDTRVTISPEDGLPTGVIPPIDGGEALVDGDGTTYYDPDLHPLLDRLTPVIIDLGAAFRVNRIRMYPRLDSRNRNRFLQEFTILGATLTGDVTRLIQFQAPSENASPVVDRSFNTANVRFLILQALASRPWEVAEIEVYGDGSVPIGRYESEPLAALQSAPVWGRVNVEGSADGVDKANVVIQTRTGPDASPFLYYMKKGDELIPVDKTTWEGALEGLKGPADPNPAWSVWETVTDGLIRSPSLNQYLQFRIALPEPGTVLSRLGFEYSFPPIARDLAAEINPTLVQPGVMTQFTLSLQALMKTSGSQERRDTGFRQLQIRTSAQIGQIQRVLIDDEEVFATTRFEPGEGFTINLWQRLIQNGSFLQVEFTAAILRERTRFEVRAVDRRAPDETDTTRTSPATTAYQVARAEDVDEVTEGGSLTVRLSGAEALPLVANLELARRIISPNGDGIGDQMQMSFSLLKLITPAVVSLDMYDLSGRWICRVYESNHANGNLAIEWDGRDAAGYLLPPGSYIFRLDVEADSGRERRQGIIGVAY